MVKQMVKLATEFYSLSMREDNDDSVLSNVETLSIIKLNDLTSTLKVEFDCDNFYKFIRNVDTFIGHTIIPYK